jgi:hypothetical protein
VMIGNSERVGCMNPIFFFLSCIWTISATIIHQLYANMVLHFNMCIWRNYEGAEIPCQRVDSRKSNRS